MGLALLCISPFARSHRVSDEIEEGSINVEACRHFRQVNWIRRGTLSTRTTRKARLLSWERAYRSRIGHPAARVAFHLPNKIFRQLHH
jgi:hypothetical protein